MDSLSTSTSVSGWLSIQRSISEPSLRNVTVTLRIGSRCFVVNLNIGLAMGVGRCFMCTSTVIRYGVFAVKCVSVTLGSADRLCISDVSFSFL